MIEDLRQSLARFDKDTVEYLEMNKGEIFKSIAVNSGIPVDIGATLVGRHNQRDVINKAIADLTGLERPKS